MAMWGWVTLEHAELYTRSVDRERLGNAAASLLGVACGELIANNVLPAPRNLMREWSEKAK